MTDFTVLIPKAKPASTVKQKPKKEKDAWSKIRPVKEYTLLHSKGLTRFFYDQIQSNLIDKKVVFQSNNSDYSVVSEILDVLKDHHCENEETIKAWVEWYVKHYVAGKLFVKSDLLRMRSMLGTWNEFAPVRPASVVIESKKKTIEAEQKSIRQELDELLYEVSQQQVERALYRFGIQVVGNYLRASLPQKKIEEIFVSVFEKIYSQSLNIRDNMQLIYRSSNRYFSRNSSLLFCDWKEFYKEHWEQANCQEAKVDKFYLEQAEEFFKTVEGV